jgi:hypothetical protein
MLLRLYSSTDEDLRKKQKEFDNTKAKASFIEDSITKAEEKKTSIQDNLEKQLTALSIKLDIEFEKKMARAGDDSDKVQELEEAKAERLSASTEKEEEKAQKDREKLEKNIEKLQGDLDVAEEKKLEASKEYKMAIENFMNNF